MEGKRESMALVEAIGPDEAVLRKDGSWGALRVGGTTAAGFGPSKRGGEKAAVRVQVDADVPKSMLRGLTWKPRPKGGVNIWVTTPEQAARVRPILERVAAGKAKA